MNRLDPLIGENPVFNAEEWARIVDAKLDFHGGSQPSALTVPRG